MTVPSRLVAFLVVLVIAFGVGAAVGEIAGPIDTRGSTAHHDS